MDDHNQPGPSLWPIGFAIGIAVLLVGLVVNLAVSAIGAVIAIGFGFAWVRAASARPADGGGPPEPVAGVDDPEDEDELMARSKFLGRATIALGSLIGVMVALPVAGFAVLPAFKRSRARPIDVGPITDFPEGQYVVTTFSLDPALGDIARRTAYVRNNGLLGGVPSFTIVSSRCTHVGCPTQPNGPVLAQQRKSFTSRTGPVALTPSNPAGFGCPCHGSQFDNEGNRTAGPAARALDRYDFSIVNGRLVLGATYSVSHVDGAGSGARIHRFALQGPGQPVNGVESWLFPVQPPQ
jgi:quinol---cytochrome c reductase iron-sulfur subunit, bacillus type